MGRATHEGRRRQLLDWQQRGRHATLRTNPFVDGDDEEMAR